MMLKSEKEETKRLYNSGRNKTDFPFYRNEAPHRDTDNYYSHLIDLIMLEPRHFKIHKWKSIRFRESCILKAKVCCLVYQIQNVEDEINSSKEHSLVVILLISFEIISNFVQISQVKFTDCLFYYTANPSALHFSNPARLLRFSYSLLFTCIWDSSSPC